MKLPVSITERVYELTYLAPTSLTSAEAESLASDVEKLVKKHQGSVVSKEDWGRKYLAYTINDHGKRHNEAVYTHYRVQFPTTTTPAFERDLGLNDTIIRHLLVVAEKENTKKSQSKADQSEPTAESAQKSA